VDSSEHKSAQQVRKQPKHSKDKTHLDFWGSRIFKPTFTRKGKQHVSAHYAVEIQFQGNRHKWSLGSGNKDAAAYRARELYLFLKANGWDKTLAKYRPQPGAEISDITVGQFIEKVEEVAEVSATTLRGYVSALRKIVSDSFDLDTGKKKFDPHSGGNARWIEKVHAVKLAQLTPQRVRAWKRSFLAKAEPDPVSQRSARVSVNSFLRQARSLFSRKIINHLALASLPNPFADLELEDRQSFKYRSAFDVQKLIAQARDELAITDPEAFKILLLAVMAGLRRTEIDLLEWSSFLWDANAIRIQETKFFNAKSQESLGDVQVDRQLMEIFRGYQARATGPFVIESSGVPKPGLTYEYQRCGHIFRRLVDWLRIKGVTGNKPLHILRKEFGSVINAQAGIHAASRALRHANVAVTDLYYADSRARVTVGLGHLLEQDNEKVTRITKATADPPANILSQDSD
jgi:integrase